MTAQQIVLLFNLYDYSLSQHPDVAAQQANLKVQPPCQRVAWDHALWMCREATTFVVEGRLDKAERWLGFVQGALWILGVFSIDEMREHVRSMSVPV
jgi:hypothetical protein